MAANSTLIALRLYLRALGVDTSLPIGTQTGRKELQKLVYLGQVVGADLGYRFSWYLMGPYCSDLADDYFALGASLQYVDHATTGKSLHPEIQRSLDSLNGVLTPPESFPLAKHDWLELLASYDYLVRVSKMSPDAAKAHLSRQKPRLAPHVALAMEAKSQLDQLRNSNAPAA